MTYTFPVYIPGCAVAVALIAAAVGLFLAQSGRSRTVSMVAFLLALFAGGILAPGLAMDRVVLDDEKLEQTTGFWFAPTVKGFRIEDVASIRIGTAKGPKGRDYEVWMVSFKNGQTSEIDPGDLWEMNGLDIQERLRARGIAVP